MPWGDGGGNQPRSRIAVGTEELLEELLDELKYAAATGTFILERGFGNTSLWAPHQNGDDLRAVINETNFIRIIVGAYGWKDVFSLAVFDTTDFGNYLIETTLAPDHRLYEKLKWLVSFASGEIASAAVHEIRVRLERERKVENLIASLANSEPINPDPAAPKLPTPDEMRTFITSINLALDAVRNALNLPQMKRSAPRKLRESILEKIDEIKNDLYGMALEIKLATRKPESDAAGPSSGPRRHTFAGELDDLQTDRFGI